MVRAPPQLCTLKCLYFGASCVLKQIRLCSSLLCWTDKLYDVLTLQAISESKYAIVLPLRNRNPCSAYKLQLPCKWFTQRALNYTWQLTLACT